MRGSWKLFKSQFTLVFLMWRNVPPAGYIQGPWHPQIFPKKWVQGRSKVSVLHTIFKISLNNLLLWHSRWIFTQALEQDISLSKEKLNIRSWDYPYRDHWIMGFRLVDHEKSEIMTMGSLNCPDHGHEIIISYDPVILDHGIMRNAMISWSGPWSMVLNLWQFYT